jgi:hypothetical protein
MSGHTLSFAHINPLIPTTTIEDSLIPHLPGEEAETESTVMMETTEVKVECHQQRKGHSV